MKSALIFPALLFLSITIHAQGTYDVRQAKWGMSMNEVLKSEKAKPVIGTRSFKDAGGASITEDEITYENMLLDNGLTSKVCYYFNNKILTEVMIIIYGNSTSNRATKSKPISFFDKVKNTTYIISALKDKGYECDYGWTFPYSYNCNLSNDNIRLKTCSLDESTLTAVLKLAHECAKSGPHLSLRSNRTDLSIIYDEGSKKYDFLEKDGYDDFFNTVCWINYKPNYSVIKELKKNQF